MKLKNSLSILNVSVISLDIKVVKDIDDLWEFLFIKIFDMGAINAKLQIANINQKIFKINLPRTFEQDFVNKLNKDRINSFLKELNIEIVFDNDSPIISYEYVDIPQD